MNMDRKEIAKLYFLGHPAVLPQSSPPPNLPLKVEGGNNDGSLEKRVTVKPLTDKDLVSEEEPRVRDLDLAERLGFSQARDIRTLIKKHEAELETYGPLARQITASISGKGRVMDVEEYLLTEEQALLLCMFSRTERAAEVRREVIWAYKAWRDRNKAQQSGELQELREKVDLLIAARPVPAPRSKAISGYSDIPYIPFPSGKRPRFWADTEVRDFIINNHRAMGCLDCVEAIKQLYGADRTPSKSSINNLWQLMDQQVKQSNQVKRKAA